jgi:hypothetical protein
MNPAMRRLLAVALLAFALTGCIVYEPGPPGYPAYPPPGPVAYPAYPVYPPAYGSIGIEIGGGWRDGGWHHHHWR